MPASKLSLAAQIVALDLMSIVITVAILYAWTDGFPVKDILIVGTMVCAFWTIAMIAVNKE